ncbi:MAG TPA: nuclear transport factor 2 family protein [Thermoanaerobaculia bacterium]|nr:nuclear transport factor 2 family protein [Thermoanaerobaculia bacterium]
MKRAIVLLLLVITTLSASAASFGSDEQTLRALDREHAIAMYSGDLKWLQLHLADDYVLITATGAELTKEQLIAQLKSGVMKSEPYEPAGVTIRAYGSTVIVSGRIVQKYTSGGERVTADLRYSDVWIKTEDGWYTIAGQLSPVSIKREKIK